MPLDINQVNNDRRLLGYVINGNPNARNNILKFNNALKRFEWIIEDPIFISGLDTTIQTFALPNTPQPITVDTIVDNDRINSLGNGEFEITEKGLYGLVMFPILTKSVGVTISHFLWLQVDIGAGFVDVPDSNSETVLLSVETNDIKTITFVADLKLDKNDKVRFMNSTTNNNLTLVTKTPPAGNGPEIPSVLMSINKIK